MYQGSDKYVMADLQIHGGFAWIWCPFRSSLHFLEKAESKTDTPEAHSSQEAAARANRK